MQKVVVLGPIYVESPRTGLVRFAGALLVQCLVGPIVIAGMLPGLEAALLGGLVRGGRSDRFGFQIPMHALVRPVIPGRGRPGELHRNALLDPPKAQAG